MLSIRVYVIVMAIIIAAFASAVRADIASHRQFYGLMLEIDGTICIVDDLSIPLRTIEDTNANV